MLENIRFWKEETAKDVKSAYRTFAKSLHPDHGGDEAEFKAMYAEYERMMKRFVA